MASDEARASRSAPGVSRRELLRLGVAGTVGAALAPGRFGLGELPALIQQGNPNRPVRRDITTLEVNDPIMVAFRHAVKRMKKLPASDPRNWDRQADIHADFCEHRSWYFFPWHRAYLHFFEEICREMTGWNGFALPYWNWIKNPRIPTAFWGEALLNERRLPPEEPLNDEWVEGRWVTFALEQPFLPVRDVNGDVEFDADGLPKIGFGGDASVPGFLEGGPHNGVHRNVGGEMGFEETAARDPLFWAHHCNVERLWIKWNIVDGKLNPNHPDWTGWAFPKPNRDPDEPPLILDRANHFVDRHGDPVSLTVADTLSYPFDHYQYDTTAHVDKRTVAKNRKPPLTRSQAAKGAPMSAEVVESFPMRAAGTAQTEAPLTLVFAVTLRRLLDVVAEENGRRAFAVLDFDRVKDSDYSVNFFVDKPDATVATPPTDPHWSGAIAFFESEGGRFCPDPGGAEHRSHVEVTAAIRRVGAAGGDLDRELTVTVVLRPFAGRPPQNHSLFVARAEIATFLITVGKAARPT